MTAVTQKEVDIALALRYAGLTIDVETEAGIAATPVEVFLEEPTVEETVERTFPSVAIKMIGRTFDPDRAHSDDEDKTEISYDGGLTPPERTSRQNGQPFRMQYSIDTWHRQRVGESRDLVAEVIQTLTPPRGYMPVTDIDGGVEDVWVLWAGGVVTLDEVLPDVVIYHKSLTVDVLACLITDPTLEVAKVATSLDFSVSSRRITLDNQGNVVVIPGQDVLHIKFRVTDTGEGPSP